jgi:hypothetical protein
LELIKIDIDPIRIVASGICFLRDIGIDGIFKNIGITRFIELLICPLGKVYLEITSWLGCVVVVAGQHECTQK